MLRFVVNFTSAIASLREQWQRTALSATGVMVGAVAIFLLVSIAKGVQADITAQVEDIGFNILIVIPGRIDPSGFSPNLAGQSVLDEEDALRLAREPGVVRSAPWTFVGGGITRGANTARSMLVATTPDWFEMHSAKMKEGRVFSMADRSAAVCVLGSIAAKQLFPVGEALGGEVQINARPYRVIGITRDTTSEQSLFSLGSMQNLVYIPYHHLVKLEKAVQTDRIMLQIRPDVEPKALIRRLEARLAERHDRQQFQVITQEDLLGLIYKVMGVLTWLLTGLTSIALFVSGVGIMTVMLMSVNERAREIGIRKAVGARASDIFAQFLSEAVVTAFLGGLAGLLVSVVASAALARWTPIKPLLTASTVVLAMGVCIGTGVVFGLLPAMRASRRVPVDALRHE